MHRRTLQLKKPLVGILQATQEAAALHELPSTSKPGTPHESLDAQATNAWLRSLAQVIDSVREHSRSLRVDIAELSVELGVAIAERLLASSLSGDRQRLDQIVLALLERVQSKQAVVIEVSPADLALLEVQTKANPDLQRIGESCAFKANPAFARGRLKLQTDEMFIDWDTQRCLAEIRSVLLDEAFTDAK